MITVQDKFGINFKERKDMNTFQRYFIDTITKHYADFHGRASRSEYWYYVLYYFLLSLVVALLDISVVNPMLGTTPEQAAQGGLLQMIYGLALFLPSLAIGVRRLHDIGRSGWWLLLSFIPIIGFLVLLYWFVQDSEPGDNQYGPNPKGR